MGWEKIIRKKKKDNKLFLKQRGRGPIFVVCPPDT
jgi:hypothetical protein